MQFNPHLAAALATLAFALPAHAHICMEAPVSRVGPNCTSAAQQKPGPCGINTRSTKYVTEFKPGETITVTLNETVNHDSHYRIAFNPNGSDFEDPTSKDDKDGKHPFVLLDGIVDEAAARQSIKVTLPDMTCDNCTLQLIQVMYDKTANGFGNDDIYYSCADIVLKGASSGIVAPKPMVDGGSGAPVPPVQERDAGNVSNTDAGSAATDSAVPPDDGVRDSGSGSDSGSGTGTDAEDEKDDGGCAIRAPHGKHNWSNIVTLLTLATLLYRRRRSG